MLQDGLYEQIINKEIENELSATDKLTQTSGIDSAEMSPRLLCEDWKISATTAAA